MTFKMNITVGTVEKIHLENWKCDNNVLKLKIYKRLKV